jgi:hypothetical protein
VQGGRTIAAQIAGQFHLEVPEGTEQEVQVTELAEKHGIDPQRLLQAAEDIRLLERADEPRIGRWLARVAETFEIIAMERADLIGRLDQIAMLSSIED